MNINGLRALLLALAVVGMGNLSFSISTLAHTGDGPAKVVFGENGEKKGEYRRVGPKTWVETDATGKAAYEFRQVSQDASAIVLEDKGRGLSLTLDLAGRTVNFGPIGEAQQPLYAILSTDIDTAGAAQEQPADTSQPSEAGNAASGEDTAGAVGADAATVVTFGTNGTPAGEYKKLDSGQWAEIDAAGKAAFTFDEVGRDASSIKLEDKSRGIALTFDLDKKAITFGAIGDAEQQPLYEIIEASGAAPGGTDTAATSDATEQVAADNGPIEPAIAGLEYHFVKLKHEGWYTGRFKVTWTEVDASGQPLANSWESGEQAAPYFHVVEFPKMASGITITGEHEADGQWTPSLAVELAGPSNKCYRIAGTTLAPQADESNEASATMDDDCP